MPKTRERIISEAAHVPSSQRRVVPPMSIEHMFILPATAAVASHLNFFAPLFTVNVVFKSWSVGRRAGNVRAAAFEPWSNGVSHSKNAGFL